MSHTPGPWTTEAAPHRAFIGQVGNGQAAVWTERQFQDGESYEWGDPNADARLIAAAPELLEALKALDASWTAGFPRGPDHEDTSYGLGHISDETLTIWRAARAAIAKAEGRS